MSDLKSMSMDVQLDPSDYARLSGEAWPLFRVQAIWHGGACSARMARFVSCGAAAEQTPRVDIDGRMVLFGSTLYVIGGPNAGREVKVVGFNLEHEPIVQATDGQALEWPEGHRRHVLDMPAHRLTWTPPVPTLLEAAEAFIAAIDGRVTMDALDYAYDDLRDAVEREAF